jgi:glycosyltransferase involved in cell wall biosynthesis
VKPIFVIPLSVDLQHMLDTPIKKKRNDVFTFMNLSAIVSRKNQINLLKGFHQAFGNDDKVRLTFNSRLFKKDTYNKLKSYIKENNITNVQITTETLSKQEYLDLLKTADCYINVARGEGFSVQPREAMALGIPVIVSNNTAQTTIANSNLVLPVESNKSIPAYNEFLKLYLGNDFDTDVDKIAEAMKEVYGNYDYYLSKSAKMRDWSRSYHYDNISLLYRNLVKPKKLILGNKNEVTADYLETNSQELYNKYKEDLKN